MADTRIKNLPDTHSFCQCEVPLGLQALIQLTRNTTEYWLPYTFNMIIKKINTHNIQE
jgi:hypothetical protein